MREYEPNADRITALYQQLEDDIIRSMIRRIMKMGYVSESTKYEAEVLQAAGLLYEDILALIAANTDASVQQVRALFEDAGVQTVEIDNEVYREAGVLPIDIRQDAGMRQTLEAGYRKTLGTMRNLVSTTANNSQQAFISACDRAYMQVSTGAFSYQQAIMQAVRGFANMGAVVTYPSGHVDKLDVAVRRAVLTGVGQTSARVALQHAEESGCYLMEITAHPGARPEHAAWQGQLVSRTGKDVGKIISGLRVYSLAEIGYGTGAGFKGWNCRHNWHPFYPGLSTPNYTPEQLAALDAKNIEYHGEKYSEYELSQMQRAHERKVREWKRRTVAAQEAVQNAPDDATRAAAEKAYNNAASHLKAAEKSLRGFCKDSGRRLDKFRTQVDGFGRSEAQKAVHAAKRGAADKGLTSGGNGGKINYAKPLEMLNFSGISSPEKITPQGLIDELGTSNIGREILQVIETLPEPIKFVYGERTTGVCGEEKNGSIKIYLNNCKDTVWAARSVIHECTHYRYGIGGSQWAECVCVAQELKHARKRDNLTPDELRMIVSAVKSAYPEYHWKKGGFVNGRRKR